jgi:hypothetical protein
MNRLPDMNNALITLDEDHITPAAARYIMQAVYDEDIFRLIKQTTK